METSHRTDDPLSRTLREHVLEPLSTAEELVGAERAEVEAERQAYVRFADRVGGIDTVSRQPAGVNRTRQLTDSPPRRVERLRSAFRETVMSVDHYDEVYGESLVEHAAAELSADVATGFRREGGTQFTEFYRSTLVSAVEEAVGWRERLVDQLDEELASLDRSRDAVEDLLDRWEGPGPAEGVESDLDDLAERRQNLVQRRDPLSGTDGHELCQYVYADAEWTYPVLTAVARVRTAAL
ncbi:DUF7260 family protein [Halosimplex halobium]|uniref:DUF7260 family protein n=1 Tax=Halosimplex halobium TaxID=3396618 RepID=UPI003F559AF1